MRVDLHEQLRVEVAELRSHHGERVAGGRALAADQHRVRRTGAGAHRDLRRGCRRRAHRAGVDNERTGRATAALGHVREPARRRDRRLGILRGTQVAPDVRAGRAEPVAEGAEQLGAAHLVAAAGTEHLPQQAEDGDHVHVGPGLDAVVLGPVVCVDAGEERAHVGKQPPPAATVALQQAALTGDVALRLPARDELAQAGGEAERVLAGRVEDREARRVADRLHEEAAVLGGGPADRPVDVRASAGLDVRNAPLARHGGSSRRASGA